jgi:hypothetical protein
MVVERQGGNPMEVAPGTRVQIMEGGLHNGVRG